MSKQIFLDDPNIGEYEKEYVNKALESGYVSTAGPFVKKFEEKFAEYIGINQAASTQSGTAALHIGLYELGIGKGDEVIVPALTFVATANPVIYVGAQPVFVDVDIETWNMLPSEIEKNITKRTKAIIPVHLYGNPCDMDSIMSIARRYQLYVIEDATESLGALYKNKHVGTFGDFGCFSFNGNKMITTGGGGMIVGHDNGRIDHIKFLINQARDESDKYYHSEIGFNYRMTNIEAALGLAQMERIKLLLDKKRLYNSIYRSKLKDCNGLQFQQEYKVAESSWWLNCAYFEERADLTNLQARLKEDGIHTRRVFVPVTQLPPYKKYKRGKFDNSRRISERGLSLPSSTLNSAENIFYVCEKIKGLI